MTEALWPGVGVALVTLFDEDARVDAAATASHAARLVELGLRGVLVSGSTGEAEALTGDERIALIEAVRAACPGVRLLAGASAAWTGSAVARTAAAVRAGADAVLVAPPLRCGDLVGFYAAVAEAADPAPVLAYHFPGVAGSAVPVEALPNLAVAGIKDSSGDPERLLAQVGRGAVYVGSTVLVGYAGALGATGAILAVANAAPELCLAAWAGDATAQLSLLADHQAARKRFPYGLKELVAARFGTPTTSRMGA
ncbi:MAG: dihydrodipicolinate synthase family protein [Micromonosporaceae bacterium]